MNINSKIYFVIIWNLNIKWVVEYFLDRPLNPWIRSNLIGLSESHNITNYRTR